MKIWVRIGSSLALLILPFFILLVWKPLFAVFFWNWIRVFLVYWILTVHAWKYISCQNVCHKSLVCLPNISNLRWKLFVFSHKNEVWFHQCSMSWLIQVTEAIQIKNTVSNGPEIDLFTYIKKFLFGQILWFIIRVRFSHFISDGFVYLMSFTSVDFRNYLKVNIFGKISRDSKIKIRLLNAFKVFW